MKNCFKCGIDKPFTEFYKHARMADGHLGKCKECTKNDVNEHRQKNLEAIRQYDRRRASQPHRLATMKVTAKEYGENFPERIKANNAVSNAVRDGRLKKFPCMVCGDEKSVGHHCDYDRPLDVVWLCQPHHKQLHAQHKKYSQTTKTKGK